SGALPVDVRRLSQRSRQQPPRDRTGRGREDARAASARDFGWWARTTNGGRHAQCAQDRGRHSHLLVARSRAHFADGRWPRRPERKVRQIVREPSPGHHQRAGGKLSDAAARHVGWPAARHGGCGRLETSARGGQPNLLLVHTRKKRTLAAADVRAAYWPKADMPAGLTNLRFAQS